MKLKSFGLKILILISLILGCIECQQSNQPLISKVKNLDFFPPKKQDLEITDLGKELGRRLFYDPILSQDSTISCASCHKQEYAFSDAGKQYSQGVNGKLGKRNTPPIFNLMWYPNYFWDGRVCSAPAQVFHPVRDSLEMNLSWKEVEKRIRNNVFYQQKFAELYGKKNIDSSLIADCIAQFTASIVSNNSKYDRVLNGDDFFTKDEYQGFVIANDQSMGDCLQCHTTDANALGTNSAIANNGLDKDAEIKDLGFENISGNPKDRAKFKVPSLRNIALTPPYMHDGRFKTLEEVIDFYSEEVKLNSTIDSKMQFAHKGGVHLDSLQKRQLLAFLNTLTDSVLIQNHELANPW